MVQGRGKNKGGTKHRNICIFRPMLGFCLFPCSLIHLIVVNEVCRVFGHGLFWICLKFIIRVFMNTINFHTEGDVASISVNERKKISDIVNNLVLGCLHSVIEDGSIRRYLPDKCHLMHSKNFTREFHAWFKAGRDGFQINGGSINIVDMAYNTAMAMGNHVVALIAKLQSREATFRYILPEDCKTISYLLKAGMQSGLCSKGEGWEKICELLNGAEEPVVISYGKADGFPTKEVARWSGYPESWDNLPEKEKWRLAFYQVGFAKDSKVSSEFDCRYKCGVMVNALHLLK